MVNDKEIIYAPEDKRYSVKNIKDFMLETDVNTPDGNPIVALSHAMQRTDTNESYIFDQVRYLFKNIIYNIISTRGVSNTEVLLYHLIKGDKIAFIEDNGASLSISEVIDAKYRGYPEYQIFDKDNNFVCFYSLVGVDLKALLTYAFLSNPNLDEATAVLILNTQGNHSFTDWKSIESLFLNYPSYLMTIQVDMNNSWKIIYGRECSFRVSLDDFRNYLSDSSINAFSVFIKILESFILDKYSLESNTYPLRNRYSVRFSGADWYKAVSSKVVTLAGIGGIGSFVSFMLARLQILNLVMYDMDTVEEANMSGQMYNISNVGIKKTDAMAHIVKDFSGFSNVLCLNEFTEESEASDIMICGFDNMSARELFYEKWKKHVKALSVKERKNCLFIDGRLSLSELQVFAIIGDDNYSMSRYEKDYLFPDNESEAVVCSQKQTTFMANMIGSVITNLFVNFCGCLTYPGSYSIPFYTNYNSQLMFFKTED